MKKNPLLNKLANKRTILVFVVSFILFFLVTVLFNNSKLFEVFDVSDVRPSAVLNPVLGLAYGWTAVIGCTLANFVSDLVSGYGIEVALMGIVPQIVYGILPYYLWKRIVKSTSMRTRLDSPSKVLHFVAVMAINAILIGLAVGAIQVYVQPSSSYFQTAFFASLNDFGVCLALGLPLMVLLDHIYSRFLHYGKRKLSDNERIILVSSLCQLIVFGINTAIVYIVDTGKDNFEIWSDIFSLTVITTLVVLAVSVVVMSVKHNKVKKTAGLQIVTKKHGTIYADTKLNVEFVSFPGSSHDANSSEKGTASYEIAWHTSLSCQKGCVMNCAFCDCPDFGYHGNVSREEFAYQINTVLDTHYVSHTEYFEVGFVRMGEPSVNDELLDFIEFDLKKLISDKINVDRVVPKVSTMLPKNKARVENFLLEYCRIKNEVYDGDAKLQFSIHSTDDETRKRIFADKSLTIAEIADICQKLPIPKGVKYALSFAVEAQSKIDASVIDKLFDKKKFLIKLTPVHSTYNAIDKGFVTMDVDSKTSQMAKVKEAFEKTGWEVLICDDSVEEDQDDLSCGKLLLPVIANDSKKATSRRVRYGIIAALKYEEGLFRAELSDVTKTTLLNKPAYTGILGDNEVIIMQCGMGKVSAGICAQAMIDTYHPDFIINTGCAGALSPKLKVGDVVVSDSVFEWDLDLREIGLPLGYIDALGCVEMKASPVLTKKIMASKTEGVNAIVGAVASGDQFVSKNEQRKTILDNFPNALCAEMEGAAIGHVCLQNGVPFCIIRSMSDTADGGSGVDFATFSEQASKVSAAWLINMLKNN